VRMVSLKLARSTAQSHMLKSILLLAVLACTSQVTNAQSSNASGSPTAAELQHAADAFARRDWAEAKAAYEAIASRYPKHALSRFRLGVAQLELGMLQDAEPNIRDGERLGIPAGQSAYRLAQLFAVRQDADSAFSELQRAANNGLMLHTMFFADEIRDFSEVDKGENAKLKPGEMELAQRLVNELATDKFKPEQYADEYRTRVLEAVEQKVEGKQVTSLAPQAQRAQVIDLMDALKQSLGKRGSASEKSADGAETSADLEKKPAARARAKAAAEPAPKKASGGKR